MNFLKYKYEYKHVKLWKKVNPVCIYLIIMKFELMIWIFLFFWSRGLGNRNRISGPQIRNGSAN